MPTETTSREGNGRRVFIPAYITDEALAIEAKAENEYVGEEALIKPATGDGKEKQQEAFRRLLDLVREQPFVSWGEDSRAADRVLIGRGSM